MAGARPLRNSAFHGAPRNLAWDLPAKDLPMPDELQSTWELALEKL